MLDRYGDWMETHTGKAFYPLDPRPSDIDIEDIAHALSMQCRFAGHCEFFYSVAEHSVHVSSLVSHCNGLWGLLHDAAEAYVTDIPTPLKKDLPDFKQIEDDILETIAAKFCLKGTMPSEVKHADLRMLKKEALILMRSKGVAWSNLGNLVIPDIKIKGWHPTDAKRKFLEAFHYFMEDRK